MRFAVGIASGVVTGLLVLMAGCGGEPKPIRADPSDAPSSSGPSATTEDATRSTKRPTPKQFIQQWVDAQNQMFMTGEVKEFDALNDPGCGACARTIRLIQDIYAGGGEVEPMETKVKKVERQKAGSFYVTADNSKYRFRDAAGSQWQTVPGEVDKFRVDLRREGESYVVLEYYDRPDGK